METTSSKQQQHVIQPTYSVAMVAFEKWRYRLYHVDIIFTFFFSTMCYFWSIPYSVLNMPVVMSFWLGTRFSTLSLIVYRDKREGNYMCYVTTRRSSEFTTKFYGKICASRTVFFCNDID